jgi:exodeoxyribonuclease-1
LYHPSWKWSICFDLKNQPKDYINLSKPDLKDAMKKSPKILRTIKTNKSPVILDGKAGMKEEPYSVIDTDEINKRIELLKSSQKFIETVSSILRDEAEEKQSMDQTDLYPEETIYTGGFASDKDKKIMKKFHESEWKDRLQLIDKFENLNNSYFAKVLIYEESPDILPKDMYNEIHREFAERLLSTNNEKWATTSKFYSELDYLRIKYTKSKDKERLKLLDEYNKYVMDIQKKFENA